MTSSPRSARRRLSLLLAAVCAVTLLPALPAAAGETYEVHHVPTVGAR